MIKKLEEDRSHPYLLIKETPASLQELRRLLSLPEYADIFQAASKAPTFEESIGEIAAQLSIALDGDYEPGPLFEMLCEALRNRGKFNTQPHLRASGLVNAELIERNGDITLERRTEDGPYIENTGADKIVENASDTESDATGTGISNDEANSD